MSGTGALSACLFLTFLTSFTSSLPAAPLRLPSLSPIQGSPDLELLQPTNLSLPSSDTFPIPKTDLTLELHRFGPLLDPIGVKSFLLDAINDLQYLIDRSSVDTPFSKQWSTYRSADGFVLEIWNKPVFPEGYGSLGELRNVIDGLSLYMMQGGRSRAFQFQVVQNLDETKIVIMNIGSIKQDVTLPNPRAKRQVSPLRLVQGPSTPTISGPANVSSLNLLATDDPDDFPIPHTPYSLRFGFLGAYLHLWNVSTLLMAVRAEIEHEISVHGRNARLPSTEYSKNLVGLQLWIQNMPWDTVNLAWAELAVIVEGLWLYMVDGRHDRETFIDVMNHVTGRQVALGWIGKPHVPLEHISSTGAVSRRLKPPASSQTS